MVTTNEDKPPKPKPLIPSQPNLNPTPNPNPSHEIVIQQQQEPPQRELTDLAMFVTVLLADPELRYGPNPNAEFQNPLDSYSRTFSIDDFAAINNNDTNNDRFEFQNPDSRGKRKFVDSHSDDENDESTSEESTSEDSETDTHSDIDDSTHGNVIYPPGFGERRRRFMEDFKESANHFVWREIKQVSKDGGSSPEIEVNHEVNCRPTPFSVALEAIKERKEKAIDYVTWVPKRKSIEDGGARMNKVPSLLELSINILADNADAMVSIDGVPDELRHWLSQLLCDSRKLNDHFLELLVSGSPTEIRLKDCSWLTEEHFTKCFQTCNTARLEVLQLDLCGRCLADYALLTTLAQSPTWLPRLTSLSLSGACRLSDKGLCTLVSSAPVLRSINLSQCSLLTSASLNILADSLGSLLKELYLDECQRIDATAIVPALKQLEHLEVLSLAGIQTVCDHFISDYIIARGHNLKELVLKDCINLTDASIKVIAERCPGLRVLDLMNLAKLTDLSIGYIAISWQALHTLKLCRNPFSDVAIAAFLEITGGSLKELSLNNIKKVGRQTSLSLASHAKNLHTLDLSWCRNLTDNELGLIVDSCISLKLLKLFGCTQATDFFLKGHSNPEILIIGPKLSPLLQQVKVYDRPQGALRYSSVSWI